MLDSDLAKLYQVETKRINEAVARNKEKFPQRITWILDNYDLDILWSQNATANISCKSRVNPRVFTEQGVYMLATILKSKVAAEVSIKIMDTFVKMRHYINYNKLILPNRVLLLEDKVNSNTKRIDELFDKFNPKDLSKNIDETLKNKYESQYSNVVFIKNNTFHDRFIILDKNELYSCGSSFKDIGKKCFAINEIDIKEYTENILNCIFD